MKTYMKILDLLKSNTCGIYAIVWGQCSLMVQSKLESLDHFEEESNTCNCIWLLKEIQAITHQFEGTRSILIFLHNAWEHFLKHRQGPPQTLHEYLKEFQSLIQVLEHYRSMVGFDAPYQEAVNNKVVANMPTNTNSTNKRLLIITAARKKYSAIVFVKRANPR